MSVYDDEVKQEHGVLTEDWCRGLYARHPEPRDATMATHGIGIVTIVYMDDPVVHDFMPVCEDCYQAWFAADPAYRVFGKLVRPLDMENGDPGRLL